MLAGLLFLGCSAGHGCQVLPFSGINGHVIICATGSAMKRAARLGFCPVFWMCVCVFFSVGLFFFLWKLKILYCRGSVWGICLQGTPVSSLRLKPTLDISSLGSAKGREDSRVLWQCASDGFTSCQGKAPVGAGNRSLLCLGDDEKYSLNIYFFPSAGSV